MCERVCASASVCACASVCASVCVRVGFCSTAAHREAVVSLYRDASHFSCLLCQYERALNVVSWMVNMKADYCKAGWP